MVPFDVHPSDVEIVRFLQVCTHSMAGLWIDWRPKGEWRADSAAIVRHGLDTAGDLCDGQPGQ